MKLTDHFSLEEFLESQVATRYDIDMTPDEKVLKNLTRLAWRLEDVRAAVGKPIIITSGYRPWVLNKIIGGAPNSAHIDGRAADIVVMSKVWTPYDVAERIVSADIVFDKVILEFGRWVHFQIEPEGETPRRLVFTAVKEKDGTKYVPGLKKEA